MPLDNSDSDENVQPIIDRVERLTQVGHWTLNLKTQKLFWSEQVFEIHGLSPDFYTPDVITAIDAYIEEDRPYVRQCVENAIDHGESFIFECRILRVDGEIRTVLSRGECERDDNNNIVRLFGTIQDITELKMEQERYELAIEASNTAIWDWDTQTDEIHWYGASSNVLGYPNNESLPQTSVKFFEQLLHEDSRAPLKKAFATHFKEYTTFNIELKFKKHDSYIWMLARGQAQWNTHGQAIRMIGSLTDISHIKEAETKLIRSNDDLDQFASIAAHDLQQPLRSISGFLEILNDKYSEKLDDKAKEYIDYSIKGAQNMSALISDLLEYSRLETDGLNLKKESCTKIIQNALRHLQAPINESDAKVTFNNMPEIICDAFKLQRVFYNLIENGIKYRTDNAPEISISCEKEDRSWHFVIQDNGIGIREDKLDDIFLMFTRLHNSNKYEGTGIGLSICKKIIDLHNGRIWVESEIDKGTSFHLTIPEAKS